MRHLIIFLAVFLVILSSVYALDQATNFSNIDIGAIRSGTAPNWQGLTGDEVIVGIVSTGIDYNHKDFKNVDGTTRFLYIWDQTRSGGGLTPPAAPFNYGDECNQAKINSGSCGGFVRDSDGFGTHNTGIAAGNGQDYDTTKAAPQCTPHPELCNPYVHVGVAPKADMIFVKALFDFGSYQIKNENQIKDAVDYIFQKAASLNKDAVVLIGAELKSGPRDGTSTLEQNLNSLTGAGKIIITSIGGDGSSNYHGTISPLTTPKIVKFNIPSYAPGSITPPSMVVEGWYDATDNFAVKVTSPAPIEGGAGVIIGPLAMGGTTLVSTTSDGTVSIQNSLLNSEGDHKIVVSVYRNTLGSPEPADGDWTIELIPSIAQTKDANFWITKWFLDTPSSPKFVYGTSQDTTLTTPSTGLSLISIGSYGSRGWYYNGNSLNPTSRPDCNLIGSIYTASSHGPRLTLIDFTVPDVVAPGFCVASSLSSLVSTSNTYKTPDRKHYFNTNPFGGAAFVTGAVALILEQCPDLAPNEIKDILKAQLTVTDSYTGSVPNNIYGYGKLKLKPFSCTNPPLDSDGDGCINSIDYDPNNPCPKDTCRPYNSLCDATCKLVECSSIQKCVSNNLGNKVCTDLPTQKKIARYSPDTSSTVFAIIVLLIALLIYFFNIERDGKKIMKR